MNHISIDNLTLQYSERIAEILSTDEKLHMMMNSSKPMKKTDAEEYFIVCSEWCKKRNAILFAILLDNVPIGSISICDIDFKSRAAKTGYWIESAQWGKGYMTKAFALVITKAKEMEIKTLTCSIRKDNPASISLWQKYGASITEKDDRIFPLLNIDE